MTDLWLEDTEKQLVSHSQDSILCLRKHMSGGEDYFANITLNVICSFYAI
jgi:hypothetical protein